jgi:hypothetical protein
MRYGLLSFVTLLFVGAGLATGQDRDSTVYPPGSGVSLPIVVRSVGPLYTSDAMRAKIEGKVVVEAVKEVKVAQRFKLE